MGSGVGTRTGARTQGLEPGRKLAQTRELDPGQELEWTRARTGTDMGTSGTGAKEIEHTGSQGTRDSMSGGISGTAGMETGVPKRDGAAGTLSADLSELAAGRSDADSGGVVADDLGVTNTAGSSTMRCASCLTIGKQAGFAWGFNRIPEEFASLRFFFLPAALVRARDG